MGYQIGGYTPQLLRERIEATGLCVEAARRVVRTDGVQRV